MPGLLDPVLPPAAVMAHYPLSAVSIRTCTLVRRRSNDHVGLTAVPYESSARPMGSPAQANVDAKGVQMTHTDEHERNEHGARTSDQASEFGPVGAATPIVESTAGVAAAALFATTSAIRRARTFHPVGDGYRATLEVNGTGRHDAPFLDTAARYDAVVRLSRGAGLPEPLPDILGVAIRVLDAFGPGEHLDLLMVTSGRQPILRHLLLPSLGFESDQFSSVLPYRVGDDHVVFGARFVGIDTGRHVHLGDIGRRVAADAVHLVIEIASIRGPWQEVGAVRLGAQMAHAQAESLRFDPSNAGDGIRPVGVLQAVRRLSYRASQAARPT